MLLLVGVVGCALLLVNMNFEKVMTALLCVRIVWANLRTKAEDAMIRVIPGWMVHAYTACGLLIAAWIATILMQSEVSPNDVRVCFLLIFLAMIIDIYPVIYLGTSWWMSISRVLRGAESSGSEPESAPHRWVGS